MNYYDFEYEFWTEIEDEHPGIDLMVRYKKDIEIEELLQEIAYQAFFIDRYEAAIEKYYRATDELFGIVLDTNHIIEQYGFDEPKLEIAVDENLSGMLKSPDTAFCIYTVRNQGETNISSERIEQLERLFFAESNEDCTMEWREDLTVEESELVEKWDNDFEQKLLAMIFDIQRLEKIRKGGKES